MTGRQEMSSEPATEQLFDEAVVWYMCLREAKDDADGDRTDDLIVRFEAWKRQSSDNVIAYAEVEFLWGRLALPVKRQVQAQKSHHW
jgi:transmembrane sensor